PNLEAAPDRRTRQHGIAPAPHVLELAQVMPETLGAARPSDARDIGNRIAPGQELTVRQPSVHDPVDAIDLLHEPIDGIGKPLARVIAEMARLPGLRPEICHLPEQPLLNLNPVALVSRIEFAGLAAKILQNGARLEDRDRPAAWTVVIDDR